MEVVKAEPIQQEQEEDDIDYQIKIELIEINKIMIEIFNSKTGIKYKTYLNKSDDWWEDNFSKFQNDFSKLHMILNNCISKQNDDLKYILQENNDILNLLKLII